MNSSGDKVVTIQQVVQAPLSKVWEAWTDPTHVIQWNFASDEWCCPKATNDVEVGGQFSYRMEAKDGSMGFDFCGKYTLVNPMVLLKYILEDGRPVQVKFTETSDGVMLEETFQGEDVNALEMQRQGWLAILGNFKKHVEQTN